MLPINFIAPLNSTGFGVTGNNLLREFYKLNNKAAYFPIGPIQFNEDYIQAAYNNAGMFDYNAPNLRLWHQFQMSESVGKGKRHGYTFFELDKLNDLEVHQLNSLDGLFLPSQWAIDVAESSGVACVSKEAIHCGVDTSIFNSSVPKATLPSSLNINSNTKIFLNVGKWEIRKGHDVLLNMFERAFNKDDNVLLVMCCFNFLNFPGFDGKKESEKWYNYYMNSDFGKAGKIFVLDDYLPTQKHLAQLMQAADFGIFPARAEGWNLDASEMLALGKQVILTDYSAHTEFAGLAGCHKIPYRTSELAEDGVFFRSFANWMEIEEPEIKIGAELMRHLYEANLGINKKGVECFNSKITWQKSAAQILRSVNS